MRSLIAAFFEARSIAVVGASDNPEKIGGKPITILRRHGYEGAIYPVNPTRDTIQGLKAYPSVTDLPEAPDVIVVAVPAAHVLPVLEEGVRRGSRVFVVFSGGFAEEGPEGRELQERLVEFAREHGVVVCGPNSQGLADIRRRVFATFSGTMEQASTLIEGPRAIVSQSGGVAGMIYAQALRSGLGFRYWVSTGNEASLGFGDFARYFLDSDAELECILGYLEGVRSGESLRQAAEAALDCEVPLVLLKTGGTEAVARAALSHTGALTGSDVVFDAFCRQYGVIRARSLREMVTLAGLLQGGRIPRGGNLGIVTISGGIGTIVTDLCGRYGLEVPELSSEVQRELRSFLPSYAAVGNPVDCTGFALYNPDVFPRAIEAVARDPRVDAVVALHALGGHADLIADALIELRDRLSKPLGVIWVCPPEAIRQRLQQHGIFVHEEARDYVEAMAALKDFAARARRRRVLRPVTPTLRKEEIEAALAVLARWREHGKTRVSEQEAHALLKAVGIPCPATEVVRSASEAVAAARSIGYPVVLKVDSPDIAHKTDVGGIVVGLSSDDEVRTAFNAIESNVRRHLPSARINGIAVQKMVPRHLEFVVAINHDDTFGPVIVVGAGGTEVDVFRDVARRIAPVSRPEIEEMLAELKASSLLTGFRGRAAADRDALIDVIARLSDLATHAGGRIRELEINPLMVLESGGGAVAVDALVHL